jgi:hypothetical protein
LYRSSADAGVACRIYTKSSFTAGTHKVVYIPVCVCSGRSQVITLAPSEVGGPPWPEALRGAKVVRKLSQRLFYNVPVLLRVGSKAVCDIANSLRPASEHIYQVVGILGLGPISECKRLEDNKGARPADRDIATRCLASQGETIHGYFMALIEGKFQPGCNQGPKITFEVMDTPSSGSARDRWHQEIHSYVAVGKLPALRGEIPSFIMIGLEALLVQTPADLGILFLVEETYRQPDIEVVRAWMQVSSIGVWSYLPID